MKDKLTFKGKVKITNLTTGEVIEFKNLVTTLGLSNYADRIMNNAVNFIDYLAVGDGVGTHTASSTALYNEIFRKIVGTKTNPGNEATFTTIILGNEAIGGWTELGLFNDDPGGILTNVVEITYTHVAGDNVSIEWVIEVN